MMDNAISIKIEWTDALFAFDLLSSPTYFDIANAAPAPKPFPKPTKIINIGVKNPTPASASAPKPDTQAASIRLYKLEMSNEIIKGIDMFINAFLGFPSIMFTLFELSLLFIWKY